MKHTLVFLLIFIQTIGVWAQVDSIDIKRVDAMVEEFYDATYENPDSALRILDAADSLAKKINYGKGLTSILRQRGSFYNERSEYVKSLGMLFAALKQDEQIKNDDGIGMDLLFLGLNYFQQEKMEESLTYMEKALKKYSDIKDEAGVALINANMGMVYRNMNRFEDALKCYTSVKNYYISSGNTKNLSRVENNIGNVYKDLKQYDKALEHYEVSKDLKLKENDQYGLVIAYSNIADIYTQKKNYAEAFDFYHKALSIAEDQKTVNLKRDVYADLSDAYLQSGDFKMAYNCFKRSTQLKDSIMTDKYNADIADMKVKYDSEKKENENVVLKKENELKETKIADEKKQTLLFALLFGIVLLAAVLVFRQYRNKQKLNLVLEETNQKVKNQNTTLRTLNTDLILSEENLTAANESKDQLLSILSHDLYNPVTSVINYTNQTVAVSETLSQKELALSFKKVNAAVVPLQDLLDNILQWARLQKGNIEPVKETVDLRKVIGEIVQLYQPAASFKGIEINQEFNGNSSFATDRLMLYFIARNVLNNAVKFCTAQKNITISVAELPNGLSLVVSDQGQGFKEAILNKLNAELQKNAVVSDHGSGIGLSISRQFIAQLKGKIEFKNTAEGASVRIFIPA